MSFLLVICPNTGWREVISALLCSFIKKERGYEVEFTTLAGEAVAVVTLKASQVRASKAREIAHVRDLTANP